MTSCSIVIFTNVPCIMLSILLAIKVTWFKAYGIGLAAVFQLFINCAIGTIIEIQVNFPREINFYVNFFDQVEKVQNELWKFPWYLLPLELQKEYLFFSMHVGKSLTIDMFMIGSLSVATFQAVIFL